MTNFEPEVLCYLSLFLSYFLFNSLTSAVLYYYMLTCRMGVFVLGAVKLELKWATIHKKLHPKPHPSYHDILALDSTISSSRLDFLLCCSCSCSMGHSLLFKPVTTHDFGGLAGERLPGYIPPRDFEPTRVSMSERTIRNDKLSRTIRKQCLIQLQLLAQRAGDHI